MIQGHSSARASETEDIDLLELLLLLWEQKLLIVAVTVLLGAVALGYAYLSPRVYEAKASVLPPRLSEISAYNLGRAEAGLEEFKVDDVYAVFTRNLTSQALRQRFFDEVYLPSQGARSRRPLVMRSGPVSVSPWLSRILSPKRVRTITR